VNRTGRAQRAIAGALASLVIAAVLFSWAVAAGKGIRFWNLTSSTVTGLELAPAGTQAWGPNQCANDPDGTVDHDERLKLVGIGPGRYDVKLTQKGGRTCVVTNLEIKENAVFAISDKDLTECER
jgi:hypothetical protein